MLNWQVTFEFIGHSSDLELALFEIPAILWRFLTWEDVFVLFERRLMGVRSLENEWIGLGLLPLQVKVREATSNDPWGPSSTLMSEIADLTYNVVAFSEIMQMVWKRLNDHGRNWRHVYKALVLLEYLIKTGSEKVRATRSRSTLLIKLCGCVSLWGRG